MCVATKNLAWERPATKSDLPILEGHFPGIDFKTLLEEMSRDAARPLTSDLVLMAAMVETEPDELGMKAVPFSAIDLKTREIVKLPVMDQLVDWFENSALGTDMWINASNWSESRYGARVHFAMNCNCGLVSNEAKNNGNWTRWKIKFNSERADLYGRTRVRVAETNSIDGLSITSAQLMIWYRMRRALESLPRIVLNDCPVLSAVGF